MGDIDDFEYECIFCYDILRLASRREIEAHLRTLTAERRAFMKKQDGTWYSCPQCGPKGVVKWQVINLE